MNFDLSNFNLRLLPTELTRFLLVDIVKGSLIIFELAT